MIHTKRKGSLQGQGPGGMEQGVRQGALHKCSLHSRRLNKAITAHCLLVSADWRLGDCAAPTDHCSLLAIHYLGTYYYLLTCQPTETPAVDPLLESRPNTPRALPLATRSLPASKRTLGPAPVEAWNPHVANFETASGARKAASKPAWETWEPGKGKRRIDVRYELSGLTCALSTSIFAAPRFFPI